MFKDKEVRKSVIASLVASIIFLIFLQPILNAIWFIIKSLSSNFYSGYIDNIYKNAALGQRNWLDFIILSLIFTIVNSTIFFTGILTLRKAKHIIDLETIKDGDNKEEIKKIEQKVARSKGKFLTFKKHFKYYGSFLYIGFVLITLMSISILTNSFADLQLNTSFNQKYNAISPYISDHEQKILKSKWALMQSKKDFDELSLYFVELAHKAGIKLPNDLF